MSHEAFPETSSIATRPAAASPADPYTRAAAADAADAPATVLRLGGVAAILSGVLFLVSVRLQVASGWFPDVALHEGTMDAWLVEVAARRGTALAGLGLSSAAIALGLPFGLVLHRHLRGSSPALAHLGLGGYLAGYPTALAGFAFAFGTTASLTDPSVEASVALASALMQGFLATDWTATLAIAVGCMAFSVAGFRTGRLPWWLCAHGVIACAMILVTPLMYLWPVFGAGYYGAPLYLVWCVLAGAVLIRKGGDASVGAPPTVRCPGSSRTWRSSR